MNTLEDINISEALLTLHGFEKHPIYDYWYFPNGTDRELYRIEPMTYKQGTWFAYLPCYFYPVLRELSTLGELSNLHQAFFDKPLV